MLERFSRKKAYRAAQILFQRAARAVLNTYISFLVAELKKKYALEVEIIKKTEIGLLNRIIVPKFAAVEIDGSIVAEGRDITAEELEREVRNKGSEEI